MRKYIHKFKNYTSVEVDNLHDLKEGDLALYEDKFVTRNNGKVEEVVKGSGSSEGEYSTDYPDDFSIIYEHTGGNVELTLNSLKGLVESACAGGKIINRIYLKIPNLIMESVSLIYDMPEASYQGTSLDPTKYFVNPIDFQSDTISVSIRKLNNRPISLANYITSPEGIIPLTIKFNTTDNKSYKFTTKILSTLNLSTTQCSVGYRASYIHCEVNYLDLESKVYGS